MIFAKFEKKFKINSKNEFVFNFFLFPLNVKYFKNNKYNSFFFVHYDD